MREQKEQEKQNELLRVVAEQNHERLIEYDVKEDRAVVYAIENDRFEVLFDIEDYVKKNHYGSVFIDPEDKKVFRRAMHACLQKEGTVTVDVRYCEKENQPEWYRFYLVSIAEDIHGRFLFPPSRLQSAAGGSAPFRGKEKRAEAAGTALRLFSGESFLILYAFFLCVLLRTEGARWGRRSAG